MNGLDGSQRRFLAAWIRATALGWALGVPLIILLSSGLEGLEIRDLHSPVGAGMGLGVGLLQAHALRKYLHPPLAWLWSSLVGLTLPFLAVDVIRLLLGVAIADPLYPAVVLGGLIVGAWQALLLRRFSSRSASWIGACTLGWMLAAAAVAVADGLPHFASLRGLPGALLFLAVAGSGGILLGLVTGLALARRLSAEGDRRPGAERPRRADDRVDFL